MKLKRFALRGLIVLFVAVALCMFFARTVQTITTPKVQLVQSTSGRFEDKMTFRAQVYFAETEEFTVKEAKDMNITVDKLYVRAGNYVKKAMRDCTGEEVCREWLYHIGVPTDRIDALDDGTLRVVDYKTGKPHNRFRDVAALFSSVAAERSPAVLQTLLYAMMLSQSENCDVQPALYYVRSMQDERFSPLLVEGDRPVLRFSDYRESLNGHLQKTLSELFDFSKPFEQCEDRSVCAYCDFREICRR